jgi:hypothetical protein
MTSEELSLVGHWDKDCTSNCSAIYPEYVEFRENGSFFCRNSADHPMIFWDVGRYRIESPGKIRMTLANDSSELYAFSISGNALVFIDARQCKFAYKRASDERAHILSN